jgi:hypothetical protein
MTNVNVKRETSNVKRGKSKKAKVKIKIKNTTNSPLLCRGAGGEVK